MVDCVNLKILFFGMFLEVFSIEFVVNFCLVLLLIEEEDIYILVILF